MATGLHPAPDMAAEYPADPPKIRAASRRSRTLGWLASILLHAIVFALLIGLWREQAPEEAPPITVAFVPGNGAAGAQGGSGGGAETDPAQEGATDRSSAAASEISATPTPAPTPQPAPEPQPQAAEMPKAPPPLPAPVVQKPEPRSSPPQAVPPRAEDLPPPPPHKPTPPARTAVASAPPVLQTPRVQPTPQVAANPTPAPTPGAPGMGQGAGGIVGRGTGAAGAGRAALGTGDLNALGDDYLDRLRRHIRRFMVYPEVAKKQKQQGEGVMTVLLRRDGTVVDVWIARSSGYPTLDQAALKAVRDSSRVPPFPDRSPNAEAEIDLPFDFHLGFLDRVFN